MEIKVGSYYEMRSGNIVKILSLGGNLGPRGAKIKYEIVKNKSAKIRNSVINTEKIIRELVVLNTELYHALNGE